MTSLSNTHNFHAPLFVTSSSEFSFVIYLILSRKSIWYFFWFVFGSIKQREIQACQGPIFYFFCLHLCFPLPSTKFWRAFWQKFGLVQFQYKQQKTLKYMRKRSRNTVRGRLIITYSVDIIINCIRPKFIKRSIYNLKLSMMHHSIIYPRAQ